MAGANQHGDDVEFAAAGWTVVVTSPEKVCSRNPVGRSSMSPRITSRSRNRPLAARKRREFDADELQAIR